MFKGDRLKKLREQRKLTQKQLGSAFNISHATINRYEKGQRQPDTEILDKLADFFDVSTDYLLGRTDTQRNLGAEKNEKNQIEEEKKGYISLINDAKEANISIEDMKQMIELVKKIKK
jgi:transcriptional regulator with XRE-family HTH domain